MSVAGSCRRSLHQRNDSDELDVFEAARYFSDYNDSVSSQTAIPNHDRHSNNSCCSSSSNNNNNFSTTAYVTQKSNGLEEHQQTNEILKKNRGHPSSPGGRIASFLNSLFSQSASKKKKSSSASASKSMKDEYDGDTLKKRRRSSISHFQSSSTSSRTTTTTTATTTARSLYSSSSSGFRTLPPYVTTPPANKSLKELKTYFDQKQFKSVLQPNDAKECGMDTKFRGLSKNAVTKETEFRKFDEDTGAESDSSSDLFELQNYDLRFESNELPVYETTDIDSIKTGTISNAA